MSEGVTIGPWEVWVCNPKGPYQYWWKIKQYSLCLCTAHSTLHTVISQNLTSK